MKTIKSLFVSLMLAGLVSCTSEKIEDDPYDGSLKAVAAVPFFVKMVQLGVGYNVLYADFKDIGYYTYPGYNTLYTRYSSLILKVELTTTYSNAQRFYGSDISIDVRNHHGGIDTYTSQQVPDPGRYFYMVDENKTTMINQGMVYPNQARTIYLVLVNTFNGVPANATWETMIECSVKIGNNNFYVTSDASFNVCHQ